MQKSESVNSAMCKVLNKMQKHFIDDIRR